MKHSETEWFASCLKLDTQKQLLVGNLREICHLQNSHHVFPLRKLEEKINDCPLSGGYVRYVMCRKGSCWCLCKGGHCQSYSVEPTWNAKQIPTAPCQTTKSEGKKTLMAGFIGIGTNFTRFRISFSSHSTWFSAGKFSKTFEHSMKGCVSRFAFCSMMP